MVVILKEGEVKRSGYVGTLNALLSVSSLMFYPTERLVQTFYEPDPGPDSAATVRMVVEIPKDSTKYEYYDLLALFKLSRALYSPMHYSGDYGFIPGTIAEDHEPLNVSCLVTNRSFTGCLVDVRPIALLHMLNGPEVNHKAVAVPACIEHHVQRELEHFFEIYKELEGRTMPTRSWGDRQTAQKIIRASLDRYVAPRKRLNPDQSRPVITDGGLAS